MRAMKDSGIKWVGEIPNEWTTGIINWIADEISVPPFCKEGFSYIGMKNVESNTSRIVGELDNAENYSSSIKYFDKETILLGKLRPYLAKAVFPKFMGICSSEFLTLKTQQVNPRYLVRLLACYKLSDCFNSDTTGVKMPRTNWAQIKKIGCPIPPFEEQEIIADYLDRKCGKIDSAIDAAERSIEEYKAYKKSVIFETVTKGLDSNAPMKDSGIEWLGCIPENWSTISHKRFMTKVKDICDKWNQEDVISLTVNGVIKRDLNNPKGKMPTTFDGYQFVYPGNLLLCLFDIDVTPRCAGRINDYGVTSPAYSQYALSEGFDVGYYTYYFIALDDQKLLLHLTPTMRSSFNADEFAKIFAIVPPFSEQVEIAEYLDKACDEIDAAIAMKQAVIEELKAYKKSLIYEVATGKREINGC